jgi:hypothetical protein
MGRGQRRQGNLPDTRPTLIAAQKQQVVVALARWAEAHPTPDEPVLGMSTGATLSARQMADAVADPSSEEGAWIFRSFARALIPDEVETPLTLEDILAGYDPATAYDPARS